MAPELEELSNDEELKELGIVFASVDVPSNRATSTRFGIRYVLDTGEHVYVCVFCVFSYSAFSGFPTLLYLHKGKMFKVPGKRNAETWKHFLTEEIKNAEGNVIPPPMSGMEQFIATLQAAGTELYDAARGNSGTEGYLIIAMVLILVLVTGGMVALCFLPAKKVPRTKQN